LISSHRLEEIEELQERVLLLDRGKAVYVGDLGAFRRQFSSPTLEITFTDVASAKRALRDLSRTGTKVQEGSTPSSIALLSSTSVAEAMALVGDDPRVVGVNEHSPSLVEVLERVWKARKP
jgi:ABC-type uncharacterized transport system ATPase subunit